MAEQIGDWIILRDGSRTLCCRNRNHWDRLTLLAVLSSDPRSIEELSVAWSRYRPNEPLTEWEWSELSEAPPAHTDWLWVDLSLQCFAWHDPEEFESESGTYAHDIEVKAEVRELIWMNIPPWWQQLSGQQWPVELATTLRIVPMDFRNVLYGPELAEDVASQVLNAVWPKSKGAQQAKGRRSEMQGSLGGRDNGKFNSRTPDSKTQATIKTIHAQWLMTPRPSLQGRVPREFLHGDRDWKERELDNRRSQWSRQGRPPTPVPVTAAVFRYGPMGMEEVVAYFDLCREMVTAAWRWYQEDPLITKAKLIEDLEKFKCGWLSGEAADGEGESVQEIIDQERQLIPRLASSDPVDCDCPLCRSQQSESAMSGPAFSICDGYHLDLEDDFAFSLCDDRDEWEAFRDQWCSWDNETDSSATAEDDPVLRGSVQSLSSSSRFSSSHLPSESESCGVLGSCRVGAAMKAPDLSLYCFGARLSEIISDMKRLKAASVEIDRLNGVFDRLARVIREWLVNEANDQPPEQAAAAADVAVRRMVQSLESVAINHPELTTSSADLQSLLHQWQRELTST